MLSESNELIDKEDPLFKAVKLKAREVISKDTRAVIKKAVSDEGFTVSDAYIEDKVNEAMEKALYQSLVEELAEEVYQTKERKVKERYQAVVMKNLALSCPEKKDFSEAEIEAGLRALIMSPGGKEAMSREIFGCSYRQLVSIVHKKPKEEMRVDINQLEKESRSADKGACEIEAINPNKRQRQGSFLGSGDPPSDVALDHEDSATQIAMSKAGPI